jgi:hypothetical protein
MTVIELQFWFIFSALTELNCTGPNRDPVRLDCTEPCIIFLNCWDWTEITEIVCSIVRRKVDYWTFYVNAGTHLSDLLRMMNLINLHTLKEIDHRSFIKGRKEAGKKRIVAWERGEGGQWKYRRFWLKLTVIGLVCCAVWALRVCAWTELDWKRDARTETKLKSGQALVDWTALYCSFAQCDCTAPKKPFIALLIISHTGICRTLPV